MRLAEQNKLNQKIHPIHCTQSGAAADYPNNCGCASSNATKSILNCELVLPAATTNQWGFPVPSDPH
ncbi:hypothetical protein ACX27_08470 [Nostoc piscinale CENA21]|uniref:Uncharacterized protein n=1 Tax=Nostoc piscinale CENA21 TaxID=224013 RepID=A0A0M4SW55_9NOSO|nr:hypothetical protein [Nostoc piscinale]ALF52884.1 hypothetical protein ACX27_08470 [Nostoc piscinale CENA21]